MAVASSVLIQLRADIANFVNPLKQANDSLKNIQTTAKSMESSLSTLKFTSLVYLGEQAFRTAQRIYQLADAGVALLTLEDSFDQVTRSAGISSDKFIGAMDRAAQGTVDDSDIMKGATRAMVEGLQQSDLIKIMQASVVASRKMGIEVSQAYQQVTDAVVMLRTRGLKTAGITIDQEDAYKKYAETLGRTKDELTEYGKMRALVNAIDEASSRQAASLGESIANTSKAWQTFKKDINEVWEMASRFFGFLGIVGIQTFNILVTGIYGLSAAFYSFFSDITKWGSKLPEFLGGGAFKGAADWFDKQANDIWEKREEWRKKFEVSTNALNDILLGKTAAGVVPKWKMENLPPEFGPGKGTDKDSFKAFDDYERRRIRIMEEGRQQAIGLATQEFNERIRILQKGSAEYIREVELFRLEKIKINKEYDDKELEAARKTQEEMAKLIQEAMRFPAYEAPGAEPEWVNDAKKFLADYEQNQYELTLEFQKAVRMPAYEAPPGEDWEKEGWEKRKAWQDAELEKEIAKFKSQYGPMIDFANQLGDTFINVFANMASGTKSFAESIKDSFKSMADAVLAEIERMIMKWLMWQAVSALAGGGTQGAGVATSLFGNVGKLFGSFAEGGIIKRPTIALMGEAGPEAVIPLSDKKALGGGDTYVYINAVDTQSFDDAIRRNPGSILKVIHKDERENIYARQ